ncbi:MAG TPA: hypothetical protein VGR28_12040 [Candidatus Thermoplasmatota archaeon]|jgi:hypothetical protein|nr:hypothetical protein [Candidatus Thermoplasmatota archaeon]
MRRRAWLLGLIGAAALASLAAAGQAVYLTDTIYMEALSYVNPVTVVPPATFVVFDNAEFLNGVDPSIVPLHSATADDGSWDTGILLFHEIVGRTFDGPQGTVITFHCRVYDAMHGAIVLV